MEELLNYVALTLIIVQNLYYFKFIRIYKDKMREINTLQRLLVIKNFMLDMKEKGLKNRER